MVKHKKKSLTITIYYASKPNKGWLDLATQTERILERGANTWSSLVLISLKLICVVVQQSFVITIAMNIPTRTH